MEEPIVLTASNIRYLLAMKELDHDGSGVRCSAIANALRLSKPSVHNMMNTFRRLGLVQKDAYRACFFTDRGNEIAARYGKYYRLVSESLQDAQTAAFSLLASIPEDRLTQLEEKRNEG